MEQFDNINTTQQDILHPTGDEKVLALMAHVLTIVAPIIAPLIIWLVKKDDSPFVAAHAKESLNFQITLFITCIIFAITIVGLFLLWAVALFGLVLVIVAAIKANEGKLYKYPYCLRLIK